MKEIICNVIRLKGNNFFLSHMNHFIFLLKYIFFLSFIITTEEKLRYLINFSWEIKLVILGRGNQGFISDSYNNLEPSEVIINGISRASCKKFCEMDFEKNNVILNFNAPVTSTENMFGQCTEELKNDIRYEFKNLNENAFYDDEEFENEESFDYNENEMEESDDDE